MKNYFELFLLPIDFEINLDELEKKYFEFQNQFHPDKSSIDEIEKSILINKAYEILADDFLRACYILQLKGIDIRNDEKAIKIDIATLETVLELQEEIIKITNKDKIKILQEKLNGEIKLLINSAVNCFKGSDINLAAQFLVKAKYLKKSLQDLKDQKQKL